MLYIIVGILFFGVLIAVHEGGHFLAAKSLDVQVNEFSIGMGPGIFKKQKGETLYSLRILPFGGYCAMEGEDEENGNPRAFSAKALWKKLIILVAGPAANLLAGFLILVVLFSTVPAYNVPVISDFLEGFPCAGEEGLMPGDRILSVNGKRVAVYADVSMRLSAAGEGPKDIVVRRNGEKVLLKDLPLNPREYDYNGKTTTMYGLIFSKEEATFAGALRESLATCDYFSRSVWQGLAMMAGGQVGLQDMSGPVGIVTYLGEAGSQSADMAAGLRNVCYIVALIAVNLAIMNLLPIPALDGGRVFLLLVGAVYRLFTRRELNPKYEAYLNAGGLVLLLMLMAVITFSDILKLVN